MKKLLIVLCLGNLLVLTGRAQSVGVSNIDLSPTTTVWRGNTSIIGGTFTTDDSADSFQLNSVTLQLGYTYAVENFTMQLMTDSGSNAPGSLIATLSGTPSPTVGSGEYANFTYTAAAVALASETKYWVIWGYTEGTGSMLMPFNDSGNTTGAWTLENVHIFNFDASTWLSPASGAPLMSISATAVPEPSTYAAIFGACALGFVAWRKRRASLAAK